MLNFEVIPQNKALRACKRGATDHLVLSRDFKVSPGQILGIQREKHLCTEDS